MARFLSYMALFLCVTNSLVDAIIFLSVNRKSKKYLTDKWGNRNITGNLAERSVRVLLCCHTYY